MTNKKKQRKNLIGNQLKLHKFDMNCYTLLYNHKNIHIQCMQDIQHAGSLAGGRAASSDAGTPGRMAK